MAYLKTDESHVSVCAIISTTNNTLEIPEKITSDNNEYTVSSISSGAFSNTSGKLLILPQTIENIASSINFGNFTYTYLKCTTPPRLESTYWSSKVIYVPQSSLALYQNDKRWVPDDYYKSYIQGTDGFVYNDSTIYELKNTTGTADLCLWMKAKSETIEIPNSIICDGKSYSITVLRSSSFSNYYDVEKFHFPASIADIGDNALPPSYGMTIISEALTPPTIGYHDSFYTQNQSLFVKSAAYEKYVLADGWKDYGKIEAFDGGDDQFYYIKVENGKAAVSGIKAVSVTEAEIPENIVIDGESMTVTQIGRKVFMNNTNLQKVILPNTIEAIGDSAFFGSRLQQITIPAYVRSIGERAFAVNTQNSTYSYLSKIQTRAGNEFFMSRNGTLLLTKDGKTLLQAAEYGGEVSSIWDYDDDGNYGRQEINPLDGIVRVANGAFDGCQISSIKIPATLTTADAPMLMYMPYLLEILVDASNEKLCSVDGILFSKDTTTVLYFPNYKNNSYYYDNSRIYELPGKVQNVARFAFYNSQFESLTLSPNLKTIADSAFYNTMYYYSSSQQINTLILTNKVIATASETAFNDGIYQNTILYIPTGSQNLYLITSPWSNFQNIISGELADEEFQILKAFYAEMDNGRGWSRKWNIGETAEQTRLTTGFRMIDGHIYSINLSNNYLNGPLSDKLFKLPKLEVLNLSNNQLACPIDSVLNEKNIDNSVLRELNISDNKFTGNIGAAGKTLKGLTTLNASYNKLSQVTPMLPTSISALSLYSQQIDTVDFKALYTANKEYVESGQPNLLFYDHENQNFTLDRTFTLEDNNYSYWQMLLSSIDGELTASEYSQYYRLYNRPNGEKLRLYSSNDNHQAYIRMLFDPGDVNFDTKVSVNDLQLTVNYAVSETAEQLFNFKTADIQSDDWVNVQDVVSLVNILLDQEIHTNSASAVSRRAANAEEAEAQLFWRGNQLVLKSERDVAALDIAIRNTQNVKWLLNDRDYDYSVSRKDGYIRIIHYSMSGKEIKAGETIIAEAVGSNMSVMKADLVGKDGSDITTIWTGNATGIEERSGIASGVRIVADASGLIIKNDKAMPKTQWAIYSIGGKLLGKGIADLSPGINTLWCNLAGENQIVMHLSNNDIHISKKISITK